MSTNTQGHDGNYQDGLLPDGRFRSEISLTDAALMLDIAESQVKEMAQQLQLRYRIEDGIMVLHTDDVRRIAASRTERPEDSSGKL